MPELSPEEKQALKGSIDFLGLNLYTAYLVEPKTFDVSVVSVESDLGGRQVQDQTWWVLLASSYASGKSLFVGGHTLITIAT